MLTKLMQFFNAPFAAKSLLFAPMEGITEPIYRQVIMKLYPQWDRYCTDFLRIPGSGFYSDKKIVEHMGKAIFEDESLKAKTTFQVLTSIQANNEYTVRQIHSLGIEHLDLNLGCPSKKVNSHGGGAFLLSQLSDLQKIISTLRKNFPGIFTVKMRIGYRDDSCFEEALKIIEAEGADAIILHARTRDQLYKGIANWSYIKKAVETLNIPLVGNGDIWTKEDVENIQQETNCHCVMVARGAMKTPWLAKLVKANQSETLEYRTQRMQEYFAALKDGYANEGWSDDAILRRFKALSRYLFDDYPRPDELKSKFLRGKELEVFESHLQELSGLVP